MSQGLRRRRPPAPVIVLAVVLGLLLCLLLALLATVGWPVLYSRLHVQPSSTVFNRPLGPSTDAPIGSGNLSRLHPVWTYTFAPNLPAALTVSSGIVYVRAVSAATKYVEAIQDGVVLWRHDTTDVLGYIGAPCVGGGAAYLAAGATIYAYDARSGAALWQYQADAALALTGSNPGVVYGDGTVYFSTSQQVSALDAVTGKLLWAYRFTNDPQSAYSPFGPSLVAGGGSVYLFLTTSPYVPGPAVTALDARRGTVRWQIQELDASTLAPGVAPLLGANGVLYRPLRTDVEALDAASGTRLWVASPCAPGACGLSGMTIDAQRLYVSRTGYVQAFDLTDGQLVWQQGPLKGSRAQGGPTVSDGVVYVATVTPVTGFNHPLFVPSRAAHWLYAFDAATGRLLSTLQANDASYEPEFFAADSDRLYVLGNRTFIGADDSGRGKPDLYAMGV